jgi:hypothetical protein
MIDPVTFTVGCACIGLSRILISVAAKRDLSAFKRASARSARRGVARKTTYSTRMNRAAVQS